MRRDELRLREAGEDMTNHSSCTRSIGVFTDYTYINEDSLAVRTGRRQILRVAGSPAKLHIVNYIPIKTLYIIYARERGNASTFLRNL